MDLFKYVNGQKYKMLLEESTMFLSDFQESEADRAVKRINGEMASLENTITINRLADAILSEDGRKWLEQTRAQIEALRLQLRGIK